MAVNKVDFAGNTLIDLTSDTVSADALLKGYTAHDRTGELIMGELDINETKPTAHIEIAPIGIWNASRDGTATFTLGNSVNRKALGTTYDVSDAQYVEFDLYIPSGNDITRVVAQTQFELSSGGKEDVNESNISINFLAEYDINYGGWTHICVPLARFVGNCDYSALNFIGWYWVGSSYSIAGCKVANLTFTSYNYSLQSKTVTPSKVRQEIFADGEYNGLSSVVVEAIPSDSNIHTVTSDCANASVLVEYFRNLRPSGCNDMIVALKPPDSTTALSNFENGQMLTLVLNGTKAGYSRWYNNALNVQTTFTTSYVCKCYVGDEYYLIPIY